MKRPREPLLRVVGGLVVVAFFVSPWFEVLAATPARWWLLRFAAAIGGLAAAVTLADAGQLGDGVWTRVGSWGSIFDAAIVL